MSMQLAYVPWMTGMKYPNMFGLSTRKKSAPDSNDEPLTFLARGFEFKGILNFDGTVRIDGVVTGAIHTKGMLIVGEHAVIDGDVSAGVIVSGGRIHGNVTAREKIKFTSTAALAGTVKTPLLAVEEGVRLKGNCEAKGWTSEHPPQGGLKPDQEPGWPWIQSSASSE
jgi:cytoskeletal protein CcmA (bactofilin family)